ncbi:ribonuclease P protein subunit p30, putative [Entamoeba invadens IP1]|uniref:Ribonuclease P protein subunit p30, putative n=2 Tax=Entamoeba invadens TaxID=33085 RepID=L7FKY7_ENTIV|nr:ribonuclease P protein subunit p30, putative [Entamoeba invadens IP1]ELP86360.1 ribonuclease P protein subunit p30, putative [Entamoeba invadens IP1]BAN42413.1 ribonuclease P protein subunit p30, putative [Entamoeba invadens]|eukprot:XP_004185706.1 ribonuclease P protein subunit p30, putative [Entamoeba invadens IP1]
MCDCCVKYSDKTYPTFCSSHTLDDFRYVVFSVDFKDRYTPQLDKAPKLEPQISISDGFSSLPNHKHLTRANFIVSTSKSISSINTVGVAFELVSVYPENEKAFIECCSSVVADIIIIDPRQDFITNTKALHFALTRGLFFEITEYSLRHSDDQNKTKENLRLFFELIKGRNIILSSGAFTSSELMTPDQLLQFGMSVGLTRGQAFNAVFTNSMRCITRSKRRSPVQCNSFTCVIMA